MSTLFSTPRSRRVKCADIKIDCYNNYQYKMRGGIFSGRGDTRWYYTVVDKTFYGSILANTSNGVLAPQAGSTILVSQQTIEERISNANDTRGPTVMIIAWFIMTLIICGFLFKGNVVDDPNNI